jgi:threonine aldolase
VIENTHNRGGGSVYSIERVRELAELAARHKLSLYLDGARLFNAVAAGEVSAKDYAEGASLASICLSKGLGAPAGSVVCGSKELIEKARRLRKCLGGAMRQSGVLAAAGLYALEHNRERLVEDHANARRLANGLSELDGVRLKGRVPTNMVYASFPGRSAEEICVHLMQAGLLATPSSSDTIRFVTHLDVSEKMVEEAVQRIGRVLESQGKAAR